MNYNKITKNSNEIRTLQLDFAANETFFKSFLGVFLLVGQRIQLTTMTTHCRSGWSTHLNDWGTHW